MAPPDPRAVPRRRSGPAKQARGATRQAVPAAPASGGPTAEHPAAGRATVHRRPAAGRVAVEPNINISLPVIGQVTIPPPEHLAWYCGLAALVVLEIIEWPIAVVVGIGKMLSENRHHKALQELGQAIEEIR